jgi:hypothetical protein
MMICHGLKNQGFIPGKFKRFFSSPQNRDQLWGPPSLLCNEYQGKKLTTHFHLMPRSSMMGLYLHSPICLHGMVLN